MWGAHGEIVIDVRPLTIAEALSELQAFRSKAEKGDQDADELDSEDLTVAGPPIPVLCNRASSRSRALSWFEVGTMRDATLTCKLGITLTTSRSKANGTVIRSQDRPFAPPAGSESDRAAPDRTRAATRPRPAESARAIRPGSP